MSSIQPCSKIITSLHKYQYYYVELKNCLRTLFQLVCLTCDFIVNVVFMEGFSRMKYSIIYVFLLNFLFSNQLFAAPTIPEVISLHADKNGSDIILSWNPSCSTNTATFYVQESLNGTSWLTVYSGSGTSGGVIARMQNNEIISTTSTSAISKSTGGGECIPYNDPRTTALLNRSGSLYFYRIKGCNSLQCTSYSSPISVTSAMPTPANISISTLTEKSFQIEWAPVSGASYYKVERQRNNSSFSSLSTTSATSLVDTPQDIGTYRYRVAACTNITFPPICSNYISSLAVELNGLVEIIYEYDALGRLRVVSDSRSTDKKYSYDAAGNRTVVEGN